MNTNRALAHVETARVFVSSTWLDLQPERRAVEIAIHSIRSTKFIGMEYFGARNETTRRASIDEVERSELYVGIFGGRYGSGITEDEYRAARAAGIPCLVYRKDSVDDTDERATDGDEEKRRKLDALMDDLGKHHTFEPFSAPGDLAAKVTADVHRWLFDEFLTPRLEALAQQQAPSDSELDLLATIRELRALGGNLLSRLEARGLVAGSLANGYVDPSSVFKRVRLDRFVGRGWITEKFEEFQRENPCGYFVVEAAAGIGKTAYMSHLAQEIDCAHHFTELMPGVEGVDGAHLNLASQLVRRYRASSNADTATIASQVGKPGFLQRLFADIAQRRDEIAPDEPIVVLIDGLEEAGVPMGQNTLGLPSVLPSGVYVVVSQRPVEVTLLTESPREILRVEAGDARNLTDIKVYLQERAAELTERIGQEQAQALVDALLKQSQGNWVYVHYIITEVERKGEFRGKPADLPRGLWQYYARFWLEWRDAHAAEWSTRHLPLLATLGALQEDATIELVSSLTGLEPDFIEQLLREKWNPFLKSKSTDPQSFAFYHASLRDFLEGRVDRDSLTSHESTFATNLASATQDAHSKIASHYLDLWGGLDNALPEIADPAARDRDAGYGLRRVIGHLEKASRSDEIHRLLALEMSTGHSNIRRGWVARWIDKARKRVRVEYTNVWFQAHEAAGELSAYLADIDRGWRLGAEASDSEISSSLLIRYALVKSSIQGIASGLGPAVLEAVVAESIWPIDHALAYANAIHTPNGRALAIARLARQSEVQRQALENQALMAARSCVAAEEKVQTLTDLLGIVTEPTQREILPALVQTAFQLESDFDITEALTVAAPYFDATIANEIAHLVEDRESHRQLQMLEPIVEQVAESVRSSISPVLVNIVRAVVDESADDSSLRVLASIARARYLEPETRDNAVEVTLSSINDSMKRDYYTTEGFLVSRLLDLADLCSGQERDRFLADAELFTITNHVPKYREESLKLLAPKLDKDGLQRVTRRLVDEKVGDRIEAFHLDGHLSFAVRCAKEGFEDLAVQLLDQFKWHSYPEAAGVIAPFLSERWLRKVIAKIDGRLRHLHFRLYVDERAKKIDIAKAKLPAFAGIAPRLAELGYEDEALHQMDTVEPAWDSKEWPVLLEKLAPHLSGAGLKRLIAVTRRIRDPNDRTNAQAAFSPDLPLELVRHLGVRARYVGLDKKYSAFIGPWKGTSGSYGQLDMRVEALGATAARIAELGHPKEAIRLVKLGLRGSLGYYFDALCRIAPFLDESMLRPILVGLSKQFDPLNRIERFGKIAQFLSSALVEESLAEIRGLPLVGWQEREIAILLTIVSGQLDEPLRTEVREEAIERYESAEKSFANSWRDKSFGEFLSYFTPEVPDKLVEKFIFYLENAKDPEDLLTHSLPVFDEQTRARVFHLIEGRFGPTWSMRFSRYLDETRFDNLLEGIRESGQNAWIKGAALHLGDSGRAQEAFELSMSIDDDKGRADALSELGLFLMRTMPDDAMKAFQAALAGMSTGKRTDLLGVIGRMSPVVAAVHGRQASQECVYAIDAVGLWWP